VKAINQAELITNLVFEKV
jgi:hypothetical protein